ncbi:hypothetical protein FO519_004842 [Halicephalobus sp. NKZ332]|nr:hypothetical protein FO519_004842 [Halicephalobus sp. NKZ332]
MRKPIVTCSTKWVTFSFEASVPFQGKVFVEDMAFDNRCSAQYISNLAKNATFRFPLRPCAKASNLITGESTFVSNVMVNFHPILIIENTRTFKVTCQENSKESPLEEDGNANTICQHEIMRKKNEVDTELTVGTTIYHKWACSKDYDPSKYVMLLRKCDVISKNRESIHLIDGNGCIVDDLLLEDLKYDSKRLEITAQTKLFKFIDDDELRFTCDIALISKSPNFTIELPKCSISTSELRKRLKLSGNPALTYFEHEDQRYYEFDSLRKNFTFVETKTLTEWILVQNNPRMKEQLDSGPTVINKSLNNDVILLEKLTDQDELKSFLPNQAPKQVTLNPKTAIDGKKKTTPEPTFGRTAVPVVVFEDKDETNKSSLNEDRSNETLTLKKIEEILNSATPRPVKKIDFDYSFPESMPDFNNLEISPDDLENKIPERDEFPFDKKGDWRLDDLILNKTDDVLANCANELARNNITKKYFINHLLASFQGNPGAAAAQAAVAVTATSNPNTTAALAANATIGTAPFQLNPNFYAMLQAQAFQWQQQQRAETNNQTSYVKEDSRQMLTAGHPTMHNRSQNGVPNALPSCNGCRELKREVDDLKRMIGQVMDAKPDIASFNPAFLALASSQRPLQQQFVTDAPFGSSLMPHLPNQILRILTANGGLSAINPGIHLPTTPAEQNSIWSPAAAVAAASTSGSNDLARGNGSVDTNVDNSFVDPVGIEGSETSSSTSSANAQAMISPRNQEQQTPTTSRANALSMFGGANSAAIMETVQRAMAASNFMNLAQLPNALPNVISSSPQLAVAVASIAAQQSKAVFSNAQQTPLPPTMQLPLTSFPLGRPHSRQGTNDRGSGGPIGGISERRKASTDDFVKNIRQCQMTPEEISKIEIPVPEALKYDQNFRPASEEQIIQQIMTSKKYESMDVLETMIQLCKKLAEKRVFGSRLMADTTVAAPNHSNYTNLPQTGIMYIMHVCQRVLGPRVKNEEEFWEYFRDSMRKLAARCRRVRHAKKMRNSSMQNQMILGNSNSNSVVTVPNALSPSIFTSAKSMVADDERSSRSSTASNPPLSAAATTVGIGSNRPFSPLSATTTTATPSSSNTSPTDVVGVDSGSSPSSA